MTKRKDVKKRMTRAEKKAALANMKLASTSVIVKRPIVLAIVRMINVGNGIENGDELVGIGWAKVCGSDVWDPKRGEAIAVGKAIHHVAEQIVGVHNSDKFAILLADLFLAPDLTQLREDFDAGFKLVIAPDYGAHDVVPALTDAGCTDREVVGHILCDANNNPIPF